jgi:hypothetical protein
MNVQNLHAALAAELVAERQWSAVALAIEIDRLMPEGVGFRNFASHYARFKVATPTPTLLIELPDHAEAFMAAHKYEGPKRDGAVIYVALKIWQIKAETSGILNPEILAQWKEREEARAARLTLFQAVNRVAKNKAENSFEAGFRVNVKQVLEQAGENALSGLMSPPVALAIADASRDSES